MRALHIRRVRNKLNARSFDRYTTAEGEETKAY